MGFDVTDLMLGIVGTVVAVSAFVSNRKKDTKKEGANEASILADLHYIKELLQDVKNDVKELTRSIDQHSEKIAKCEERLKSLFARVEKLEKIHERQD